MGDLAQGKDTDFPIGAAVENIHIWDPRRVIYMEPSPDSVFMNSADKGLAPDAPPCLDQGVLEDSTGFTLE